jgi:hypothetical protein
MDELEFPMLTMTQEQMDHLARAMLVKKLDAAFERDVPDFKDLTDADRAEFFEESLAAAQSVGLKTEQGVASYALAVWWLGLNFEEVSEELKNLLLSDYPEVRKVHAMNEWVHVLLGDLDDISGADEKLRQALETTAAWGQ